MKFYNCINNFIHISILKTIWVNFRYLPFRQAIYLPILLHSHSNVKILRGGETIWKCPIKFGILRIGSRSANIVDYISVHTTVQITGKLIINGNVWIGAGCRIFSHKSSILTIGNNVKITGNSFIDCHKKIYLGNDCMISWNCQFIDSDYHKIIDNSSKQLNLNRNIIIENNVWIACNCIILKGTHIASGSIIAAGSVVSKNLNKEKCIYGGVGKDFRILKEDIKWSDL
jgi:acetyltransferase-like isoleucine patch superfamily enzyme